MRWLPTRMPVNPSEPAADKSQVWLKQTLEHVSESGGAVLQTQQQISKSQNIILKMTNKQTASTCSLGPHVVALTFPIVTVPFHVAAVVLVMHGQRSSCVCEEI